MRPIKFTEKNGLVTYHYKGSELIPFIRQGFKTGDVGMVLVRRQGNFLTFKGFGVIENPSKTIHTLTIVHMPALDGKMPTDQQRIDPPKPVSSSEGSRLSIYMLDFSLFKQEQK